MRCWGQGINGKLGYDANVGNIGDTETPASVGPVNLGSGRTAVQVGAGEGRSCALMDNAAGALLGKRRVRGARVRQHRGRGQRRGHAERRRPRSGRLRRRYLGQADRGRQRGELRDPQQRHRQVLGPGRRRGARLRQRDHHRGQRNPCRRRRGGPGVERRRYRRRRQRGRRPHLRDPDQRLGPLLGVQQHRSARLRQHHDLRRRHRRDARRRRPGRPRRSHRGGDRRRRVPEPIRVLAYVRHPQHGPGQVLGLRIPGTPRLRQHHGHRRHRDARRGRSRRPRSRPHRHRDHRGRGPHLRHPRHGWGPLLGLRIQGPDRPRRGGHDRGRSDGDARRGRQSRRRSHRRRDQRRRLPHLRPPRRRQRDLLGPRRRQQRIARLRQRHQHRRQRARERRRPAGPGRHGSRPSATTSPSARHHPPDDDHRAAEEQGQVEEEEGQGDLRVQLVGGGRDLRVLSRRCGRETLHVAEDLQGEQGPARVLGDGHGSRHRGSLARQRLVQGQEERRSDADSRGLSPAPAPRSSPIRRAHGSTRAAAGPRSRRRRPPRRLA